MALDQINTSKTGGQRKYDLSELEKWLRDYEKWYEEYLESQEGNEENVGENPTPPPPPPPGGS